MRILEAAVHDGLLTLDGWMADRSNKTVGARVEAAVKSATPARGDRLYLRRNDLPGRVVVSLRSSTARVLANLDVQVGTGTKRFVRGVRGGGKM